MKTDQETLRQEQQSLTRRLEQQKRYLVHLREEMVIAPPEERARLAVRCEQIEREIKADEARLVEIEGELASPHQAQEEAQPSPSAKRPGSRKKWGLGGAVLLVLAVAALAADPDKTRWNQRSVTSADLAREYRFTDVDGRRPDSWNV